MRIACISDIHGNIYALNKVLEHIDEKDVDQIICLGDLTGFGPHPNEVVALIRRRRILCLKGNYDASVADNSFAIPMFPELTEEEIEYVVSKIKEY